MRLHSALVLSYVDARFEPLFPPKDFLCACCLLLLLLLAAAAAACCYCLLPNVSLT